MTRKNSKTPAISIVIPAYNSVIGLTDLLTSLNESEMKNFQVVINDDVRSSDDTKKLLHRFKNLDIVYIKENRSMAQGRKRGVVEATAPVLLHLDTDMKVTPGLLGECIRKISEGYDALVIPEESYGTTFWAKCKWLEKRCYNGVDTVESLRCVKKTIYNSLGGHNEKMVFSEDKDFDMRVRAGGHIIGRTVNFLHHNEGHLRLRSTVKKKHGYTKTARLFQEKHPEQFRKQSNPFLRYKYFLINYRYFFRHPVLYVGMFYMKTFEFGYGAIGYITAASKK